jgi:hypothetical protein
VSGDDTIRVWDARTGIMLPCSPIVADDTPGPEPMIGGWFTNINTGRYMGALPVGASFHPETLCGSTYVGWTGQHQLVRIHFPEL